MSGVQWLVEFIIFFLFYVRGVITHMISRYGSIMDIGKVWGHVKLYFNDRVLYVV